MMHFEVLVEDASGKIALEYFLEKILGSNGDPHSYRIISYKGIGSIPKDLRHEADPRKKILLDKLPSLLRGYGRAFRGFGPDYPAIVVVVCDLDRRDKKAFITELEAILTACDPHPDTVFRLAVEEGEAWLLGDRHAVEAAYPRAKSSVLDSYVQDSICGTWEILADAVHEKGAAHLKQKGHPEAGIAKCQWANAIAPHVDVDRNQSPSFQLLRDYFRSAII